MTINIDQSSGFCWGVVRTVEIAEESLKNRENDNVYILGQIIHNPQESERLEKQGLMTISHKELETIDKNSKVLIRAHGEPPSTYEKAKELGINLIDATCPLVTALQKRVIKYHTQGYQIVIFGKREHAEVIGLRGVCNDECVVVKTVEDVFEKVDFQRKTVLISQTTMDKKTFYEIKEAIEKRVSELVNEENIKEHFEVRDTLCRAVYGREAKLKEFAKNNDLMIFVSGKNSSNGKSLYHICLEVNQNSYFIEDESELKPEWFDNISTVGISGATSTPQWHMELIKTEIEKRYVTTN